MYDATLTMTHEGEFDGIPPTGREVEVREMAKYHVADGKIQEYRVCFDQQAVFEQL
jgi:predicted ester cyclase